MVQVGCTTMGEINFTLGNFSLFGENLSCVLISSPPALSLTFPSSKWFCYFNSSKWVVYCGNSWVVEGSATWWWSWAIQRIAKLDSSEQHPNILFCLDFGFFWEFKTRIHMHQGWQSGYGLGMGVSNMNYLFMVPSNNIYCLNRRVVVSSR